jgi:quinol monooxygenase YgiN
LPKKNKFRRFEPPLAIVLVARGEYAKAAMHPPTNDPRREFQMRALTAGRSRRTFLASALTGGIALTSPIISAKSLNRSNDMETTIRADTDITTLVNVLTVEPDTQQKLLELLTSATDGMFSTFAGWISTSLLASRDGKRVVIYSQWRSNRDIEAFRKNPDVGPYFQRIAALAKLESFECDVSYVNHA